MKNIYRFGDENSERFIKHLFQEYHGVHVVAFLASTIKNDTYKQILITYVLYYIRVPLALTLASVKI